MIDKFFTVEFTQYRSEWLTDAEGNDYSDTVEVGSFKGHIQQADKEMVERYNMSFQTAFSLWCDIDTDVQKGDILENDTDTYSVKAIQVNNIGRNKHLELAVEGGATMET